MRVLMGIVLALTALGLAGSSSAGQQSWEELIAGASMQDIDNSSIYRALELQGTELAYLIHDAQVRYRDDQGHWAEYQVELESGGYLQIPQIMLENADFMMVAMHDMEAPGYPVSSYEAEVTVRDPQSGWQYGCVVNHLGRIIDIADTYESREVSVSSAGTDVNTRVMGSVWPRPVLNNVLPMTARLREAALRLSSERGITGPDKP
ncbi:hypothetical protein IT575_00825 [bacterium]|nr:hypothetical protein [bacterium]